MQRRKFLQTGVGVALAGAVPIKILFAQPNPQDIGQRNCCTQELDKLRQIVQRYGSEFGQVKTEEKEGK